MPVGDLAYRTLEMEYNDAEEEHDSSASAPVSHTSSSQKTPLIGAPGSSDEGTALNKRVLTRRIKLGFGFGDTATACVTSIIGFYFLVFMVEVAGTLPFASLRRCAVHRRAAPPCLVAEERVPASVSAVGLALLVGPRRLSFA